MDDIHDANDPSEKFKITKIWTIRNMHGILNALKRIQCLICHRETPGFDIPFSDLRVLERGEKVLFADNNMIKCLKKSKVLDVSVRLDFSFNKAEQCVDESKFFREFVWIVLSTTT